MGRCGVDLNAVNTATAKTILQYEHPSIFFQKSPVQFLQRVNRDLRKKQRKNKYVDEQK